ncbi:MAG: hypothetical protein HKP58_10880 [Desulfatitalea sp.]|nr:hypothetical protein [Desulfatitalea sp.]NNK00904.1 hypothetical protein [Desulfatitalea sp.]
MTQETYKYRFDQETVQAQDMEDTFMLALMAVESLHSRSRVRMEVGFVIDKPNRTCTIDAVTPVGQELARIFTGFATREYGERAVHIERIASSGCACASKVSINTTQAASMETTA